MLPLLLVGQDPASTPNFWVSLGVFIPTIAGASLWIRYLIALVNTERAGRVTAEEKFDRQADRMLELSERVLPLLTEVSRVLPMAVEELKRERRR